MSTKSARTRRLPFPIFGIRLKAMLEQRQMTQAELARKIGIDARTMNHAVSGNSQPWGDLIVKSAKILDCSADFLMGRSNEMRAERLLKAEIMALRGQNARYQTENETFKKIAEALAVKTLNQATLSNTSSESSRS